MSGSVHSLAGVMLFRQGILLSELDCSGYDRENWIACMKSVELLTSIEYGTNISCCFENW